MLLIVLLGALLIWLSFDKAMLRDRKQWPIIGIALLGLIMTAKGRPVIGTGLFAAVALWSRWPRLRARTSAMPASPGARADAYDLLGLSPDADRAAIIAAHRRLIARNHPDSGGTAGLAARLNAARDLLLKSQ